MDDVDALTSLSALYPRAVERWWGDQEVLAAPHLWYVMRVCAALDPGQPPDPPVVTRPMDPTDWANATGAIPPDNFSQNLGLYFKAADGWACIRRELKKGNKPPSMSFDMLINPMGAYRLRCLNSVTIAIKLDRVYPDRLSWVLDIAPKPSARLRHLFRSLDLPLDTLPVRPIWNSRNAR